MGRLRESLRRCVREGADHAGNPISNWPSENLAEVVQEYELHLSHSEKSAKQITAKLHEMSARYADADNRARLAEARVAEAERSVDALDRVCDDLDNLAELAMLERDEMRDELERVRAQLAAAEEEARGALERRAASEADERRRAACAEKSTPSDYPGPKRAPRPKHDKPWDGT